MSKIIILLPKINTSGGYFEARNLAAFFRSNKLSVSIKSIFPTYASRYGSIFSLPYRTIILLVNFITLRPSLVILTHFSTFFFAPILRLFGFSVAYFVQDLEWIFPSRNRFIQKIFYTYCRICFSFASFFFFGNTYLLHSFQQLGIVSDDNSFLFPVGIDISEKFTSLSLEKYSDSLFTKTSYDYDVTFLLRNPWFKNNSFYFDVLNQLSKYSKIPNIRVLIVDMRHKPLRALTIPNLDISICYSLDQSDFYKVIMSSRFLLCLSLHEGFGLPPFEAMYLGRTLPLVLDNGGCRCYLTELPELLLDRDSDSYTVASRLISLLFYDQSRLDTLLQKAHLIAMNYIERSMQSRNYSFKRMISKLF